MVILELMKPSMMFNRRIRITVRDRTNTGAYRQLPYLTSSKKELTI